MIKKLIIFLLLFFPLFTFSQDIDLKKLFKFSTFYGAVNGGTSISDVDVYSVNNGLETSTIETPFDYSVSFGVRRIARFAYENRANTFYDGTESNYSDGATIGKSPFEFLSEIDYTRQQGQNYVDQHHFIRYVKDNYILKGEYLEDGFADVSYFETSQRYRYQVENLDKLTFLPELLKGGKLSLNIGAVQRIAEPYGYDPLDEWRLSNGNLHYTYLAIEEGYNVDVYKGEYYDPSGAVVATSTEVWEAVVIPEVLADYVEKKRDELPAQWNHSLILGYDYYYYSKNYWVHSWGNVLPYHYDAGDEFSYHTYNNGEQWYDYSGGLIVGYKWNRNLGAFLEGTYNKYWNREWYDFKVGLNYVIF